ncbi:MAG: hypothetical protein AB7F53_08920, partial [Nitrososphaeraceae archaeon]
MSTFLLFNFDNILALKDMVVGTDPEYYNSNTRENSQVPDYLGGNNPYDRDHYTQSSEDTRYYENSQVPDYLGGNNPYDRDHYTQSSEDTRYYENSQVPDYLGGNN